MTLESTKPYSITECTSVQNTRYYFYFRLEDESEVVVYHYKADEKKSFLIPENKYTVFSWNKGINDIGGYITLSDYTVNLQDKIIIVRKTKINQLTPFATTSSIRGDRLEDDFDKSFAILQELENSVSLSPKFDIVDNVLNVGIDAPEAEKGIMWNEDGTRIVSSKYNPDFVGERVDDIECSIEEMKKDILENISEVSENARRAEAAAASAASSATAADSSSKAAASSSASAASSASTCVSLAAEVSHLEESAKQASLYAEECAKNASESARTALGAETAALSYATSAETAAGEVRTLTPIASDAARAAGESASSAAQSAKVVTDLSETIKKYADKAENNANYAEARANRAQLSADKAEAFAQEVEKVASKLSGVYKFKGSVNTYSDLPEEHENGDVWDVKDTGKNYAWSDDLGAWDDLGGSVSVDASNLAKLNANNFFKGENTFNGDVVFHKDYGFINKRVFFVSQNQDTLNRDFVQFSFDKFQDGKDLTGIRFTRSEGDTRGSVYVQDPSSSPVDKEVVNIGYLKQNITQNLENYVSKTEAENFAAKSDLVAVEIAQSEVNKTVDVLTSNYSILDEFISSELGYVRDSINAINTEQESIESRVYTIEDTLDSIGDKLASREYVEEQIETVKNNIESIETDLKSEISSSKDDIDTIRSEQQTAQSRMDEIENTIYNLDSEFATRSYAEEQAEYAKQEASSENDMLESRLTSSIYDAVEESRRNFEEANRRIDDLLPDIDKLVASAADSEENAAYAAQNAANLAEMASQSEANADASCNEARRWAIGSIEEEPEGSAKYWAQQAAAGGSGGGGSTPASTTKAGVVYLATGEEALEGLNADHAMTPALTRANYVSLSQDSTVEGNVTFTGVPNFENGASVKTADVTSKTTEVASTEFVHLVGYSGKGFNAPNYDRMMSLASGSKINANGYLLIMADSYGLRGTLQIDGFTCWLYDIGETEEKKDATFFYPVCAGSTVKFSNCKVIFIYCKG